MTFSIFLSSLSQRNFSLALSLLVKDYSGRQRKYCRRYLEAEGGGEKKAIQTDDNAQI